MPLYEYECLHCGEVQEVLQRNSKQAPPKCPNCDSENTRRLISAAVSHASAGSSSSASSCPTGTCPF